jgi:flagellar biosynthesis/type III secretory pathway chaperone
MRTLRIVQTKFPTVAVPSASGEPTPENEMARDLQGHLALCQEILAVVEKECQTLRHPDPDSLKPLTAQKKSLLPRLNQSLDRLRQLRQRWQQMEPAARARQPGIGGLLRQNQDLIMKIIVLDRENEQTLLRQGMIPVQQLPPAQRQQAHYVTELYRRQGAQVK